MDQCANHRKADLPLHKRLPGECRGKGDCCGEYHNASQTPCGFSVAPRFFNRVKLGSIFFPLLFLGPTAVCGKPKNDKNAKYSKCIQPWRGQDIISKTVLQGAATTPIHILLCYISPLVNLDQPYKIQQI